MKYSAVRSYVGCKVPHLGRHSGITGWALEAEGWVDEGGGDLMLNPVRWVTTSNTAATLTDRKIARVVI